VVLFFVILAAIGIPTIIIGVWGLVADVKGVTGPIDAAARFIDGRARRNERRLARVVIDLHVHRECDEKEHAEALAWLLLEGHIRRVEVDDPEFCGLDFAATEKGLRFIRPHLKK